MKRLLRQVGVAIGLLATIGVAFYAARTLRTSDLVQLFTPKALAGIGIATVAYSFVTPSNALAWRRLLCGMGLRCVWLPLATIMGITQLAKYLPGNVGQHVGRAAMSVGRGIPFSLYLPSVVAEAALAAVAAMLVGLAGCASADLGPLLAHTGISPVPWGLLTLASVVFVIASFQIIPSLIRRITLGKHSLMFPDRTALRYALLVYIANYVLIGIGASIMAMMVVGMPLRGGLLVTGAFSLGWLIGFFTPGAPAGLGVREGAMLALLQLQLSHPDALLIVMGLRLATTAGDILCFMLASIGHLLMSRRAVKRLSNET
jgi:hypothetical protein